jgi:hypothetical protein
MQPAHKKRERRARWQADVISQRTLDAQIAAAIAVFSEELAEDADEMAALPRLSAEGRT